MAHWVTPAGPSICVVPFMKSPWKCRLVLWFPSWFSTLTTTRSPTVAVMGGKGHCPLMPMVGRSSTPSGFADTQVMLKSYVTVTAFTGEREPHSRLDATKERAQCIMKGENSIRHGWNQRNPAVSGLRIQSSPPATAATVCLPTTIRSSNNSL